MSTSFGSGSHEVGSYVGGLGVDASADAGEESLRRSTHTEGEHSGGDGDEGGSLSVVNGVKNNKPDGDVEQSEIDFPAPVSPVRIFKPFSKSTSASSMSARFLTCRFLNIFSPSTLSRLPL